MYGRHMVSLAKGNTCSAEIDKPLFVCFLATLPIIARKKKKA